jgi:hypothetical protein
MGYYMRYISADADRTTPSILETALRPIDGSYEIQRDDDDTLEGILIYKGDVYGQIYINRPDDDLFDAEIAELKESVENVESGRKGDVVDMLGRATELIVIQVLDQGRATSEETLLRIDPVWSWLFANRDGLMKADGEGYYNWSGLILDVR